MLSEPFEKARPILEKLEKHNHQAFFVGGCVRDLLLKRPIGDIDITTSAPPTLVQQLFEKVIPVGLEHGTVIVIHKEEPYEVTTFRLDGTYSDQRHPDTVTFVNQIDKDLERRDFTINALAMDLSANIIDLFGGRRDLELKLIKTVGNGYERFKEDSLRIIRALRFSSQLGFKIDYQTLIHMKEVSDDISSLAVERITKEFGKLFAGEYPQVGLKYLKETEVYKYLPIFKENADLIFKIPSTIRSMATFGEVMALFHLIYPSISVNQWAKNYKCSNEMKNEANAIVKAYSHYTNKGMDEWLVYKLDEKYYKGFTNILSILHPDESHQNKMEDIHQKLPIQSRSELCINGKDLIEWFPTISKGPWIEETIVKIEKETVYGNIINSKNEVKDWIKLNPSEVD